MLVRAAAAATLLGCTISLHAQTRPARAPAAATVSRGDSRLAALGEVYAAVEFFDPALARQAIAWDSVVAAAVPALRRAPTDAAFAAGLQKLLAVLGDPATRVASRSAPAVSFHAMDRAGTLVLTATTGPGDPLPALKARLERASRVAFLLPASVAEQPGAVAAAFSALSGLPGANPLPGIAQRVRRYDGLPQGDGAESAYHETWDVVAAAPVAPDSWLAGARVAFAVGLRVPVPALAVALQQAGRATIAIEGQPLDAAAARVWRVPLPGRSSAVVRTGDPLDARGEIGIHADSALAPGMTLAALEGAALRLLDRSPLELHQARLAAGAAPGRAWVGTKVGLLRSAPDTSWSGLYPGEGLRALGAFRVWAAFRYFFPHLALSGENWDSLYHAYLPGIVGAASGRDYTLALAEWLTHAHDTHVTLSGVGVYLGSAPVPLRLTMIDGTPIVTSVTIDSVAKRTGIRPGDAVVEVDGMSVAERIRELARVEGGSTTAGIGRRIAWRLLSANDGSTASVLLRRPDGTQYSALLPRSEGYMQAVAGRHRDGCFVRTLPGGVGYLDVDNLPVSETAAAQRALQGSRALVLDMRGYPSAGTWSLASWLALGPTPPAARFLIPRLTSPDTGARTFQQQSQPVSAAAPDHYLGPTVMLVNERTQSSAEHFALHLEAARGTRFVGSTTAGANGNVTWFRIPGGAVLLTGMVILHGDGRPFQRLGIVPEVVAAPTPAGLAAGRDEVLEAALRLLGVTEAPPPDTAFACASAATAAAPADSAQGRSAGRPPATPSGGRDDRPDVPPPAWTVGNMNAGDYRVESDTAVARTGAGSGHIYARAAAPHDFGTIAQMLRAARFRGTRVRLSGWVRTRGATRAELFMRMDGGGGSLGSARTAALTGDNDWVRQELVVDVPTDAAGLYLALILSGPGEAWLDDVVLERVGKDAPALDAGVPRRSSDAQAAQRQRSFYARFPVTLQNPGLEP